MIITDESHPNIVSALMAIETDTGMTLGIPVREIPERWDPYLTGIDRVIGSLSKTERAPEDEPLPPHVKADAYLDSEFYAFCNGEETVMTAIANRSLDHQVAAVFLFDFFEDWSYTTTFGTSRPDQVALSRRIEYIQYLEKEGSEPLPEKYREELIQLQRQLS